MRHKLLIAVLLLFCADSIFGLTGFGESNIFGISEETLPVELSSFTATVNAQNYVQLNWVTQSESNLNGYYIYRGSSAELSSGIMVSGQIQPTNTSSQQSYSYLDREISQSGQYYYWLQSLEMDGSSSYHGPIPVLVNLEGAGENPTIPLETGLRAIYPNPFNPSTTISYQLKTPNTVYLDIYNARGQKVHTLYMSHSTAGLFSVLFDGRDSSGRALASGIYRVVMTAGTDVSVQKIVLMK
ncbi:MAG: FlgD immunoglobulin-like domain containing protein [Candidatus Cloacimonadaceae bacterium]|nr:FlgD immunoglobulin-like domain containing protein [Candidatus Cloacimonadaceae bacterium]